MRKLEGCHSPEDVRLELEVPRASPRYRVLAWQRFQRALDPLAPPRPLRRPRVGSG